MKKIVLITLFILMCATSFGAFTTSISNRNTYKNSYRWTGKPKDRLLLWAQEVENRADGTSATEFTFYTPTDTEPATNEGTIYYDLSEHKLKFRNASSWVAIEAGSTGNSLDGAYDVGRSITVDAGVITLTGTDPADNIVLAIVQADIGSTVAQTITSAGTGALLTFDSNGTGADILGSDSTWTITKAGASTFVGVSSTGELVVTSADVLFDDTFDVAWDSSRDTFLFQDSAILGLGGAHDADADTWFIHDGSNLSLLSLIANEGFLIGGTTAGFDITYAFETAGQIRTDYNADFINLTDDMDLRFGTGGSADGDFKFSSDSSNLLTIDVVVAGTGEVAVGNDADDVPWKWYAETGSDWVYFNVDEVEFEDVVLQMMDATQIQFGDSDDFFMHATNQAMTMGTLTSDETSAWNFGADTDGDDLKFFGATTSEYWLWDASADSILPVCGNALYTMTDAEADQFKVNATGTVAGDAINFETTDGGILLNADGGSNGDIELNSADDIILTTAGKLTITNGSEAMTVSGALTVSGVSTNASAMIASGIQDVAAGGTTTALTIATKSVFTVGADVGGDIMTIVNGTAGQVIYIICEDATGTVTVTPGTFGGGTSITFNAVGDAVTLVYTSGTGWNIVGGNSFTII